MPPITEYMKQRFANINNGRPLAEKKKYTIPKVSEKRKAKLAEQKENTTEESMMEFFIRMRSKMKGVCSNCGGKSCKDNDQYFHFSISHIFPKNNFKTIDKHESNWIELCYFDNSCHTMFDTGMLKISKMNCFDEIVEKFQILYPLMNQDERRRLPEILLNYVP